MTTTDTKRAEEQARAQLDSIVGMVKRIEHIGDCDGSEDCELTGEEIYNGIDQYYSEADKQNNTEATEEEREQYHNEDEARQSIDEDPLSVQVRSGWHNPGEDNEPAEYEILLCTGGPACRIVGAIGNYSEPDSARIEYQDWFTPWVELVDISSEEREALLVYAQHFLTG